MISEHVITLDYIHLTTLYIYLYHQYLMVNLWYGHAMPNAISLFFSSEKQCIDLKFTLGKKKFCELCERGIYNPWWPSDGV